MAKSFNSAVSTYIGLQQKRPALLFELGLSISGVSLYFTNFGQDINFGGHLYQSKKITISGIQQSAEGQINRVTLNFDNTSRDMSSYASYSNFHNKSLLIKRVFLDDLSSADNYNEVFTGNMESPEEINQSFLTLSATEGKALYKKTLLKQYQKQCNNRFGDTNCNRDGYSDLTNASNYSTGAVQSGTSNYFIMTAGAGVTGTVDDIFKYGRIQLGYSGVTTHRICSSYESGTSRVNFNISLPFILNNNYRFTIYKGCPYDWDSCGAENEWGPTANNQQNYMGFLHIGKKKDQE